MTEIYYWTIIGTSLLSGFTPGPGSLAIAATSMARGPKHGFALAYGMSVGALIWALVAALGMGAVLINNQWLFETLRYLGAAYLLWLGFRCAKSALQSDKVLEAKSITTTGVLGSAAKGVLIHLTNPKVLLYWASIFVIAVKPNASPSAIIWVVVVSLGMNIIIVTTWASLFSRPAMMAGYLKMRRWLEGAFAAFFGTAAVLIVTDAR